jgi:hypothetical protein
MDWEKVDWKTLERLRAAFLDGTAGAQDYWRTEGDLESYDQTFGQRIRWKWDYVLNELKQRGWVPSPATAEVIDWGCGSGIATRSYLDHFGLDSSATFHFWDRSPLAMQYAARKTREAFPDINVWLEEPPERMSGTLLISHVLTELEDKSLDELLGLAVHATSVIWVEPGTYDASRKLITIRERLRSGFQVVSPCTHQAACGMLTPENERHWCHHFAPSPPEVFMNGNWARFAKIAGVDLRSLPLSFLVLDKRPTPQPNEVRGIGRPRVYKAHSLLLGCNASGVRDYWQTKREHPEEFRLLKKGKIPKFLTNSSRAAPTPKDQL